MLSFDPAGHTYKLDGVELESVTTILQAEGYIDTRWYGAGSADKGSRIHDACAALDEGALDAEDFEGDDIYGYVLAWVKFKAETGFIPSFIEVPLCEESLLYAGTLDRFGKWKGNHRVILDIKSGAHELWHGLQLAAYSKFPEVRSWDNRRVVHLQSDGKYKICDKDKKIGPYDGNAWDSIWKTIALARLYRKRYAKI